MKYKFLGLVAGAALAVAGCVSTVSGNKAPAVPLMSDQLVDRVERPVGQVYDAAHEVLKANGMITAEITLPATNVVKALEGKVNERTVWIRVEQEADPKITTLTVQARTKWGGTDLELVHQLGNQIILKLAK